MKNAILQSLTKHTIRLLVGLVAILLIATIAYLLVSLWINVLVPFFVNFRELLGAIVGLSIVVFCVYMIGREIMWDFFE